MGLEFGDVELHFQRLVRVRVRVRARVRDRVRVRVRVSSNPNPNPNPNLQRESEGQPHCQHRRNRTDLEDKGNARARCHSPRRIHGLHDEWRANQGEERDEHGARRHGEVDRGLARSDRSADHLGLG